VRRQLEEEEAERRRADNTDIFIKMITALHGEVAVQSL
jgi:hypothetical protein